MKHKHILFAFDHYNTLGALRSLAEVGITPIVILYGEHTYLVKKSRYINILHEVKTVEEGYKILVESYGRENPKPFLYSCDDFVESYLDLHADELLEHFYFFNGARQGIVSKYMNKEAISELAVSCGASIPKIEKLKRGELPSLLKYPVITKSIMSIVGGWKSDVFICQNEDELEKAYKLIKSENLLVEEFIQKKNELCLDGFCFNNGDEVVIPYQSTYIRVAPGKYGNYMLLEPFKNEIVYNQVKMMLKAIGFNGVFSVEYLIGPKDELYFLEINFRNSTWSYAFTVGGVNLLVEWAKATIHGRFDGASLQLRTKPFTAMVEINDFADFVMKGKLSFFKWLKDMNSCDCLFYYNKLDKRPALVAWKKALIDKIQRIFNAIRKR